MFDSGFLITVLIVLFLYLVPAANAYDRKHRNWPAILMLNILLGWTAIGWVVALIWSYTGKNYKGVIEQPDPTPETHIKCPDCRELVLKDARKCKHCGCHLVPQ